ncbi:beta strand repeat-containing protein [Dokdonella soli]
MASSANADTTTLTVASGTKDTSSTPVPLLFPVTRGGDLVYDAILNYQTLDGTAQAGVDYATASGFITVPAGATGATIPVTVSPLDSTGGDLTFQLLLTGAVGIGPQPGFTALQSFAAGTTPIRAVAADVNGDGKPDLIVTNRGDNTVSVLLNTTAPGATTPSFAVQQTFANGSGPRSVVAVDVNGDSRPDLIVANTVDNTVSVLLNTTAAGATTASFAAGQTFAVGSSPSSIAASDLNGDGKLDLVVANAASGTVSVLFNTTAPGATAPSFAGQHAFATGSGPASVTVADMNGDGRLDLIVVNTTGNTLSVLFNTTAPGAATPSFSAQQAFGAGIAPTFVAAADVNGDGKPDLVLVNTASNTVSVFSNKTPPGAMLATFAGSQSVGTGNGPSSVGFADLNGDGKPDLIIAYTTGNMISVLVNATAPGSYKPAFVEQQNFVALNGPASIATADLNGDGHPDLIVGNASGGVVSVLLNAGTSSTAVAKFVGSPSISAGPLPVSADVVDINGDGILDVVVANLASNTVSVLLNTTSPGAATPALAPTQSFGTGSGPRASAVADLNGDGKPDLITANETDNTVSVLLNTTTVGATTVSFGTHQDFGTGAFPFSVAAADLNGDGKPDIVTANAHDSTVSVLFNTTVPGAVTPSFATQQVFATGNGVGSVAIADVNGDGKPDIVVSNYSSNTVEVLLNTTPPGAATPSFAARQAFATGRGPYWAAVADVNGDGMPDLVVANSVDNTVSVLLNTSAPGATTLSFSTQQTFAAGTKSTCVASADVDGDGRPDLVVTNQNDGTVSVLLNTTVTGATTARFAAQQTYTTRSGSIAVAVKDINGDGKPDLTVANVNNGTISVLLNTQFQTTLAGSPATGTIVHDYIFANGFE